MSGLLNQFNNADSTDMREAGQGSPIAPGQGFCRLIGVMMMGRQASTFNNQLRYRPEIHLLYELHSPQLWPLNEQGEPIRKREMLTYSNAENAKMHKRWMAMDPDQRTRNMFQLIGQPFLIALAEGRSGKGRSYISVESVRVPVFNDPASGQLIDYRDGNTQGHQVPAAITPFCAFDYDNPSIEQWDSLFIPGNRDDGSPLNVFQNTVRIAQGFEESHIAAILRSLNRDLYTDYDSNGQPIPGSRDANLKNMQQWKDFKEGRAGFPGSTEGGNSRQGPQQKSVNQQSANNALQQQVGYGAPGAMPPAHAAPAAAPAGPAAASPVAQASAGQAPSGPPAGPGQTLPTGQALDDNIPY